MNAGNTLSVELTVIVPTISRPTLARTLMSLRSQEWWPGDRVIVLGDGVQPGARALTKQFPGSFRYVECPGGPYNDWSHTPRNWLLHKIGLSTSHFCVLDDDDVWFPGTRGVIQPHISSHPTQVHIFRMDATSEPRVRQVLWIDREVRAGNVGTPMMVCPFDGNLGNFPSHYTGDMEFIRGETEKRGVLWHDEVIVKVRPL